MSFESIALKHLKIITSFPNEDIKDISAFRIELLRLGVYLTGVENFISISTAEISDILTRIIVTQGRKTNWDGLYFNGLTNRYPTDEEFLIDSISDIFEVSLEFINSFGATPLKHESLWNMLHSIQEYKIKKEYWLEYKVMAPLQTAQPLYDWAQEHLKDKREHVRSNAEFINRYIKKDLIKE